MRAVLWVFFGPGVLGCLGHGGVGAKMDSEAHLDFQPVSFGKYLLLQKIGSGGMAEIYRAKAFGPHDFVKEYAIKKILPHLIDDEEFMTMFIDEARIAVNLQHANIVQVFDLGAINRQSYIAMEYVQGRDLLELLARCDARGVRRPLKLALCSVMEVRKGLEYAHRARDRKGSGLHIVHRDVSPCNILLSYNGEVKISDFGVAKAATQRSRTEVGMLKGKVGYMSPEQIAGETIDKRSDIFSAGIVLFEMLAMRRLFIGPNDLNVMLKIRDGDIGRDLEDLDFLPSKLRDIVMRALSHRRRDRYRSAQELHRAVMDFVYENDLRVTDEDLGRFLRRVFAREYAQQNESRQRDPDDISAFPALQSPQVARYRFREPNGSIVGPMSLETLMSILRYRSHEAGNAISVDGGAWVPPDQVPQVRDRLEQHARRSDRGIPSSHHLGYAPSPGASPMQGVIPLTPETPRSDPTDVHERLVKGSLVEYPFPLLLHALYERRDSGLLKVTTEGVRKAIFIENGAPGYVASNQPDELLGNFLCEHGVISASQLQVALNRMSEFGGRLGDVLIREGMLPETELFHYLSLQTRQKLLGVFTWAHGTFEYHGGRLFEGESYPLGIATVEIVVQGIRSRYPVELIRDHFEGRLRREVGILEEPGVHLDELKLTAKELGVAASIRDCGTIERLLETYASASRVEEDDIWRVLFILYCTRMLRFEHTVQRTLPVL